MDQAGQADDAVREELRLVEEELAELRRTAEEARRRIGDRSDWPTDPAEIGMQITAVEEQRAVINALEARRDALRVRLGE
jgi:hypothetical protein